MNNDRRARIERAYRQLQVAFSTLEAVRDEEYDVLDNIPENLQYSKRAEELEDNVDTLDYAIEGVNEALNNLEDFDFIRV